MLHVSCCTFVLLLILGARHELSPYFFVLPFSNLAKKQGKEDRRRHFQPVQVQPRLQPSETRFTDEGQRGRPGRHEELRAQAEVKVREQKTGKHLTQSLDENAFDSGTTSRLTRRECAYFLGWHLCRKQLPQKVSNSNKKIVGIMPRNVSQMFRP